ncbi:MAG: CinA family nicotinamide mononucleotide deamidase-related protein [Candidatus Limnocylindria bacterium]
MRAELLSIGTELLLGQIVDTNSAWLSGRLAALGIDCHWMSTVGDNLGRATEAVRRAWERSELVVCTGGLGPTEDDLTREAVAAALGETVAVDPALEADLRRWFAARGVAMPERNRKQAWLIPSSRALANPLGTAPGWLVERDGRTLVAMPGVPREMTRMWEHEVEPVLVAGTSIRSRTLKLLGIGESTLEETIGDLVRSTAPTVATYAKSDGVHVRITDRDADAAARDARIAQMESRIRELIDRYVWGVDGDTLGGAVGRALGERSWRLATAEGLTGGELARAITEAQPEGWYAGGVVRPGAAGPVLAAAVAGLGAEVQAFTEAAGTGEAAVRVRTPLVERSSVVRYGGAGEGRRRAVLAALDLVRRAVAGEGSDPA